MYTYRKASIALALVGLLATGTGCKDFFAVNVDPLNPSTARLSDMLPVTQVSMGTYLGFSVNGLSQYTSSIMQQLSTTRGVGSFQQTGDSFSTPWQGLYADMLSNNEQIIKQGTAEQAWSYVGIAELQKAYVISQMVDMWGNIPYSEALVGTANRSPKFDKDSEIYADLFRLIDDGLVRLNQTSSRKVGEEDLMYKGELLRWAHFGRTLKLKLYNQIRLTRSDADFTNQINALIDAPSNLLQESEDFELRYGSSTQPDNRNLGFIGDYVNSSRENTIGVYLYTLMTTTAPAVPAAIAYNDPRVKYYFFNQASGPSPLADYQPNGSNFVTVRFGSTGPNTSANNSGVRTLPGLYPVGGRYDVGGGGNAGPSFGKGTVAQRLLTYFSRKFTEAELQLTVLNNPTAARAAYEEGIRASFRKVNSIAAADGSPTITDANINSYVTRALTRFDNPAPTAKLKAIMTEKYIASFGFGLDAYTDFRRTGYPNITVPASTVTGDPYGNPALAPGAVDDNDAQTVSQGSFPRRLTYDRSELQFNINADPQPDVTSTPIFWDKR